MNEGFTNRHRAEVKYNLKSAFAAHKTFFTPSRKDDEEVREEVGSVAGATRENVREEPGPGWALKEARLHFTFESPNTGLMKDTGKFALFVGFFFFFYFALLLSVKICGSENHQMIAW